LPGALSFRHLLDRNCLIRNMVVKGEVVLERRAERRDD
jgi:hypothetical protein